MNIDFNKLNLINEILKKNQNFEFEDGYSYEIIISIPSNSENQYSIGDLKMINIKRLKTYIQKNKIDFSEKKVILEKLLLFKKEFFSLIETDIKKIKSNIL